MAKLFSFLRESRSAHLIWLFLLPLATLVLFLEFIVETGGSVQVSITSPSTVELPRSEPIPFPDHDLLTEAKVLSVIDGDTIEVEIDGQAERLRYYGIKDRQQDKPCAVEATTRNRELVEGKTVFSPTQRTRQGWSRSTPSLRLHRG